MVLVLSGLCHPQAALQHTQGQAATGVDGARRLGVQLAEQGVLVQQCHGGLRWLQGGGVCLDIDLCACLATDTGCAGVWGCNRCIQGFCVVGVAAYLCWFCGG